MAWTTPAAAPADGQPLASAYIQTMQDNIAETGPAKVTTAGDLLVATGAGALKRLGLGGALQVLRVNAAGNDVEWGDNEYRKVKETDESVSSSTALQDDADLVFPVGANEIWSIDMFLRLQTASAAAGGLKTAFTFPAAGTLVYIDFLPEFQNLVSANPATANVMVSTGHDATSGATGNSIGRINTLDMIAVMIRGTYVGGANAGSVQFQWAQNTSNATATIVRKGSWLRAVKLN